MVCPCGGTLKKRKLDVVQEIECSDCGRSEVQTKREQPTSEKFDYSLPERIFPLRVKPFEDIGNKLISLTNKRIHNKPTSHGN